MWEKERKKTDKPNEGWGRRTGSPPARAGFWKDDQGDRWGLWAGAGAPGGTVRRAAVRKRGPGSMSLYEHQLPE